MTDELTEARAAIAKLREALEPATKELNAIRARDGAPQHITWERGQPIQLHGCDPDWWNELTEQCFAALAATSSDCYAQIRAEVLEEAAQSIERKMQSAHHDFTSWQARNLIRALKDKP